MKTIGIIGGMSFESTITYYKTINETINNQLGNLNSAKILLYSVNFEEIANLQKNGEWEKAAQILGECAKKLELGGADFILIATNTVSERLKEHAWNACKVQAFEGSNPFLSATINFLTLKYYCFIKNYFTT